MKKKVLLIDDSIQLRSAIEEHLKKHEFEVITADDGLDGLDKLSKYNPDLIITGIIMPRMDGFDVVRNIKSNIKTNSKPVFVFSHLGRKEDIDRMTEMGVDGIFINGVTMLREVEERIAIALGVNKRKEYQLAKYKIEVCTGKLDAEALSGDYNLGEEFSCQICSTHMQMELVPDFTRDGSYFQAHFVCPSCSVDKE